MAEAAGGARWRPGGPGRYFRLPRPAAVSTLAALTSPRARSRRGGDEEELLCRAAGRGMRVLGRRGEAGRGGVGGALQASVPGRHTAQPKSSQVRGGG